MKLTKICRALIFKSILTQKKGTKATNKFKKNFLKLMINSVYGKTMEKLRKRISVKMVNNEKESTYISRKIFDEDYAVIHEIKPVYHLTKQFMLDLLY